MEDATDPVESQLTRQWPDRMDKESIAKTMVREGSTVVGSDLVSVDKKTAPVLQQKAVGQKNATLVEASEGLKPTAKAEESHRRSSRSNVTKKEAGNASEHSGSYRAPLLTEDRSRSLSESISTIAEPKSMFIEPATSTTKPIESKNMSGTNSMLSATSDEKPSAYSLASPSSLQRDLQKRVEFEKPLSEAMADVEKSQQKDDSTSEGRDKLDGNTTDIISMQLKVEPSSCEQNSSSTTLDEAFIQSQTETELEPEKDPAEASEAITTSSRTEETTPTKDDATFGYEKIQPSRTEPGSLNSENSSSETARKSSTDLGFRGFSLPASQSTVLSLISSESSYPDFCKESGQGRPHLPPRATLTRVETSAQTLSSSSYLNMHTQCGLTDKKMDYMILEGKREDEDASGYIWPITGNRPRRRVSTSPKSSKDVVNVTILGNNLLLREKRAMSPHSESDPSCTIDENSYIMRKKIEQPASQATVPAACFDHQSRSSRPDAVGSDDYITRQTTGIHDSLPCFEENQSFTESTVSKPLRLQDTGLQQHPPEDRVGILLPGLSSQIPPFSSRSSGSRRQSTQQTGMRQAKKAVIEAVHEVKMNSPEALAQALYYNYPSGRLSRASSGDARRYPSLLGLTQKPSVWEMCRGVSPEVVRLSSIPSLPASPITVSLDLLAQGEKSEPQEENSKTPNCISLSPVSSVELFSSFPDSFIATHLENTITLVSEDSETARPDIPSGESFGSSTVRLDCSLGQPLSARIRKVTSLESFYHSYVDQHLIMDFNTAVPPPNNSTVSHPGNRVRSDSSHEREIRSEVNADLTETQYEDLTFGDIELEQTSDHHSPPGMSPASSRQEEVDVPKSFSRQMTSFHLCAPTEPIDKALLVTPSKRQNAESPLESNVQIEGVFSDSSSSLQDLVSSVMPTSDSNEESEIRLPKYSSQESRSETSSLLDSPALDSSASSTAGIHNKTKCKD
ncbi:uncharacterized protein LOC8028993 [Ixodes scapularis]|uniref:uncharacterized protein LOC8028993 n=1 Tax=Ixodes scapularis TaxID=6945 RepID=UPI001A9D6DB8|nr:uncharacterized protein LOC8028993 [Ixodes scapularis]